MTSRREAQEVRREASDTSEASEPSSERAGPADTDERTRRRLADAWRLQINVRTQETELKGGTKCPNDPTDNDNETNQRNKGDRRCQVNESLSTWIDGPRTSETVSTVSRRWQSHRPSKSTPCPCIFIPGHQCCSVSQGPDKTTVSSGGHAATHHHRPPTALPTHSRPSCHPLPRSPHPAAICHLPSAPLPPPVSCLLAASSHAEMPNCHPVANPLMAMHLHN